MNLIFFKRSLNLIWKFIVFYLKINFRLTFIFFFHLQNFIFFCSFKVNFANNNSRPPYSTTYDMLRKVIISLFIFTVLFWNLKFQKKSLLLYFSLACNFDHGLWYWECCIHFGFRFQSDLFCDKVYDRNRNWFNVHYKNNRF